MRRALRTSLLFSLLVTAALSLSADPSPKRDVFSIPLPKRNVLRFIVVGDAGTGDPHLHNGILRIARQTHIDAILLVGDNVYPCGVTSVNDPQWSKVTINFADSIRQIASIVRASCG